VINYLHLITNGWKNKPFGDTNLKL